MGKRVEHIFKGVEKIEVIAKGEVRVICVEEDETENKVLKKDYSDDMFAYIDFKNFINNGKKIMAYMPETEEEKEFKELLKEAIEVKVANFYCAKIDPSFSDEGEIINFEAGKMPAIGLSYYWWESEAKKFSPERNSRLGTRLQYVAFLGVLMLKLVEEKGMSVEDAWDAVCNNSKDLGHFSNSKDSKYGFEVTGSREVCGFCDLANTCKYLASDDDNGDMWVASGCYEDSGRDFPLADMDDSYLCDFDYIFCVGWLVLS